MLRTHREILINLNHHHNQGSFFVQEEMRILMNTAFLFPERGNADFYDDYDYRR